MKPHSLFLLVYLLGFIFAGRSSAQTNALCTTCGLDATSQFLQCVGLPSTDTGKDHIQKLKALLGATMDLYTFMKSSMKGVPLLNLEGALELRPDAHVLQNEALVQMWVEVQMIPLLNSITKHFLSCLSTKNFSCSTYQIIVREISQYYSDMNPERQQWLYNFFMYPFLSGNAVAGCVNPGETSEEWLLKNFGAFRAMGRLNDFSSLNLVFSGLEVLNLLSPTQKAELLLSPGVENLDNGTLSLVFHSLLTGGSSPTLPSTYNPYPKSSQNTLTQVLNGFSVAFTTVGSFAHEFVSFTNQRNVSEIKGTTLTQFLLNFTLSELANIYQSQNSSSASETAQFDVMNVDDWYQHVVIPVLQTFWPSEGDLMHENVTLAFHELFYLNKSVENTTSEIQDVCSMTLDKTPCGLTDDVEHVANVLHCAARTNLTMTETTVLRLIDELMRRLNSLIKELSTANFGELMSDFQAIFSEEEPPSLTQQHLEDPGFIKLWFRTKLSPLLPNVSPTLLSCLSTKNFSCRAFQTLVAALGSSSLTDDSSYNIYKYFIFSFLQNHNSSDPQCISSANNSAVWLENNFGFFSQFASITDFYDLNPYFTGLEALPVLSTMQLAQMLLLPLRTPPEKGVVINQVFDFLLESPQIIGRFEDTLLDVVQLARKVNPPCDVYRLIFERMYQAISAFSPDVEPIIWARIEDLINTASHECVPTHIACPETPINGTNVCRSINSSDLQSYWNTSMQVSCSFLLESYACAKLEDFTANQLASLMLCNLPGNSGQSRRLWKMLFSELSDVLDPALDVLANMSGGMIGSSAQVILDVISEMRLSLLTNADLRNSTVIQLWFSVRLRNFLPFASGRFLQCLTMRNISCQSYQQILQVFSNQFEVMSLQEQHEVLNSFILPLLSSPQSGPGCLSSYNNSADWLTNYLGPFSMFLSVKDLLDLNPEFNPLGALQFLTPVQTAELLVLNISSLPNKDAIINLLFDYMTQLPKERNFTGFLSQLVGFLEKGRFSCSSYKTLFTRLDEALATVPSDLSSSVSYSKTALLRQIPPGCIIYSGQCKVTLINETEICLGKNSTNLQLQINSRQLSGRVCGFTVGELACASLSALTAQDLAELMTCNLVSNSSGSLASWKLLLSKASLVLDKALDLLANSTLETNSSSVPVILDAIREIRLDVVSTAVLNDPAFIQLWLNSRLYPFLHTVSTDFLTCFATKDLNCSTYQNIVQILSRVMPQMVPYKQMSVYTHFIQAFLARNDTVDPACSLYIKNSAEWLQKNLGGFSSFISTQELLQLHSNFSVLDTLSLLTVQQLAFLSAKPGQLTSPDQVTMVMMHVSDQLLASFFDGLSTAISSQENTISSPVRSTFLQIVFDRANLSYPWVDDSVVTRWLQDRLPPLLIGLPPNQVQPYFQILAGRSCGIQQQGVANLNLTIPTLSQKTQQEIYNYIIQTLKGPPSLRCYNYNSSFYSFVEGSFLGFQFPNLTTFLSLMPQGRLFQLVNSIPPSQLANLLQRPHVVDDDAKLCDLYNNYYQTPMFLATESLPAEVGRPSLSCVWPTALSSHSRSEVNIWFNQSLQNYFVFLTKSLISPAVTANTSCLAFQKLVSVLDAFNYTAADFGKSDVFEIITSYLSTESTPKCYNSSDPELNSTAWFVEYIGPFMPFLTLEVLQSFGSEEVIQVFTVNPLNIALLSHSALPQNLTNFYTQLIYQQDSNFNPLLLPLYFRCVAPGLAFTQLTAAESMVVLHNFTNVCTDPDPQIFAALSSNFGDNIDASVITALGDESASISAGQLMMIKPEDLKNSLNILANVMSWSKGQATAIIQSLTSSGVFQINSSSSLVSLGFLIVGIPSTVFVSISDTQILMASQNPSIVGNLMSAPAVVQLTFVNKIISVSNTRETILQNVPDEMATEIPRVLLQGFTDSSNVVTMLNRKTWKRQQAELFFNVIAVENATAELGSPDNLSSSALQGFTCTSVRTLSVVQVKKLIRACRRTNQNKVSLEETQLTCMYNYVKGDPDATSFHLYPPNMLLYYDYSLVPQSSCRSYFAQLGNADFFIFSSVLSYKRTALFVNARSCLGITNTSLTLDHISILGNMCCMLDGSYIVNSDPSILETLKSCPELTAAQAAAVEALLTSGNTTYGVTSSWNRNTLINLGMLPLYLTSTFYGNFDKRTKRTFLGYFLKVLNKSRVSKQKTRRLKQQIRLSLTARSKRATVTNCMVGSITQVTISDNTFPFDYSDINQFNSCLSAAVVKANLQAIASMADQEDYLKIVLSKLREAYNSSIPEDQVQVLGPASRVATIDDIKMWTITQIDTLAALMDSSNGVWDPTLAKAIITKYLSVGGNTLGSAELNVIGGPNLCSLDVSVLRNISQQSLKNADALNVSSCTEDKVTELFSIAIQAFASTTRAAVSVTIYQLLQSYMSGANVDFIKKLVAANISMDLPTFTSLNGTIVLNLTVSEVQGLLGTNLPQLKDYENQTLVQLWISNQLQSQLDTLNIGLVGGRVGPVTVGETTTVPNTAPSSGSATAPSTAPSAATTDPSTAPSAATTAPSTAPSAATTAPSTAPSAASTAPSAASNTPSSISTSTASTTKSTITLSTTASTTKPATTGAGSHIQADIFSFLVLLTLLISSQQLLM
ncbi:uncharacterized protein [Nothobranchius furzeri]|uniref:Uncharacterized LOC107389080 n=2 Tax=Nothobranchius furzeri TaxID=105023 RepID=A0A8C6NMI8_NOTFU|nr:uncharacterized protein LOC107389080 isoform X1 [Nothobranchius furzeri]